MTTKPPRPPNTPPNTPPKIFPRFFVSEFESGGVVVRLPLPSGTVVFPVVFLGGSVLLPFYLTGLSFGIYGMLSDTSNLNSAVPFYFATKLTNKLSLTLTV